MGVEPPNVLAEDGTYECIAYALALFVSCHLPTAHLKEGSDNHYATSNCTRELCIQEIK